MPTRTLVAFASLSLASLLIWGCADGPSSAANGALPGAPAGPSLEEAPGEVTLGGRAPAPGAVATGCGDDDLQCICELALGVFDKCGGFFFDGEAQNIEIPRDACHQAGAVDEYFRQYCEDGDCSLVNQVLTCVVDTPICSQDTFTNCAAQFGGNTGREPRPGNPPGNDLFACTNGGSVPASWVCDGEDDCGDNSDELVCQ